MYAANPVRETWIDVSIPAAHGAANGLAVDMGVFAGPITAVVTAGASLAVSRTVTFQTALPQAANACLPDAATWTTINLPTFCGDAAPGVPLSVVLNPAVEPFLTDDQYVCRVTIPCQPAFLRAVLSAADTSITVHFMGKARRVVEA